MDKLASDLRRGDRVWIGGKGWRSLTSVRRIRNARWISGEVGDAIDLRWRDAGGTVSQHVKPDAMIAVEERA